MIRAIRSLLLLSSLFAAAAGAQPQLAEVAWPSGWQVQALEPEAAPDEASAKVSRQRAVKNDENGDTILVMELTMTQVEVGHVVNLQGVLLEMRKSIQKDFFQGGYQSVCNKIHPATLSRLAALETTCTITQNGRHVLSQTLVAAVEADKAYVFSYAGQADAYAASQKEIQAVRESLKL
ncbi:MULTISPECIES: DUF4946 domain-containing protein [Pseudomonas]|uniref:DUF4946 domain-containing protein n=1 Tax=Pseudomonas kielensis TaxID=2762577 RepID=A0A7X1GAI7_9PSED|nr:MULTISPECIES: DUF4946 domain-containing protein [Pseudomonas]MBC2688906.1 DUF4946 domain-containing protein [Pseudomonas kielensis]NBB37207.1 DUF4946 domain-containing protein [Pseudomonas sp. BC115LW]UZM16716.1 DUF4946 domain-containing protein [Pseudomonas kielensis]WKL55710.1 DUF4946 domain-containing protein [Pseudomonas kielensis]